MGSQQKRRKGTKDNRNAVSENKRQQDLDTTRTALQPTFEIGHSPLGIQDQDFIHVHDEQDTSSQTVTAPFNTVELNCWLKCDLNFRDSSNEKNVVYPFIAQKNTPFFEPGVFGAGAVQVNYPTVYNTWFPDYIEVRNVSTALDLDFTTGFSYNLWVRPRTVTMSFSPRILVYANDASNWCQLVISNPGQVDWIVSEAGVLAQRKFVGPISANVFTMLSATYNASTNVAEVYVNKVAGVAGTSSPSAPNRFNRLQLGCWNGGGSQGIPNQTYFQGAFDEVMYFKAKILTQTEINNLFSTNHT